MISFQIEPYDQCKHEVYQHLRAHFAEIAMDQAAVPLDIDEASYRKMADENGLLIVTCRIDGVLVGYIVGFVRPHLHYHSSLHCFTDIFYLAPEHRKGGLGIKLFTEYEKAAAKRGVRKIFIASKVYLDMSKVFERLGWTKVETVYSKILGGDGSTGGMPAWVKVPC